MNEAERALRAALGIQGGKLVEAANTKSESILSEAARITGGDRQQDYGSPRPNHELIAAGWALIIGAPVTAEMVARCNIWTKLARDTHSPKRDNTVDIAGYAWVLDQLHQTKPEPTP